MSFDTLSFLENNLSRQLGWIQATESKISFIFAINTALLGVLAALLPNTSDNWTIWLSIPVVFTSIALLLSILFLSLASFPRTKGPAGSVIYFGGIMEYTPSEFSTKVHAMKDQDYIADLLSQCHRNAEIVQKKYKWIKKAMISLYISILPWVLSLFLLYKLVQPKQ